MRHATRLALGGVLLTLVIMGWTIPGAAQDDKNKVTLQALTYDELGKLVRSFTGKVVVVDFWWDG